MMLSAARRQARASDGVRARRGGCRWGRGARVADEAAGDWWSGASPAAPSSGGDRIRLVAATVALSMDWGRGSASGEAGEALPCLQIRLEFDFEDFENIHGKCSIKCLCVFLGF